MAEPGKTEQPTAKRLSKAREKGSVPTSQEMLSVLTLVVLALITIPMGPKVVQWATLEIRQSLSCDYSVLDNTQVFMSFASEKVKGVLMIMAPFFAALMAVGITANMAISGRNFSLGALRLNFKILKPSAGLKNIFSLSSLVKLGLSLVKIFFIGFIVFIYLRGKIDSLATFQWIPTSQMLGAIASLILGVLKRICIGLLIIGIVDLIYQKWKYIDNMKMSKQDVKDEKRAEDTPPEVKRSLRQKQFEAAMRRMLQDVPKADVVLVNPTHVAVALQYDGETMQAPVVVAKGGDYVCEKIKEVARAYGVPIIRRPSLARSIYSRVEIGQFIPDSLFVAVAEVLALIYRLRHNRIS
ncbi:MAG: flagellar biosynthesis protein FlhB [Planctomycetota bacterium]|jgi:flagellar biosynthetic protein FlhB